MRYTASTRKLMRKNTHDEVKSLLNNLLHTIGGVILQVFVNNGL